MANHRGGHYRAIMRAMRGDESLLWYGRPLPERRFSVTRVLGSAVVGLVVTVMLTDTFARTTATGGWSVFIVSSVAILLMYCVVTPWASGPTLYALTDQRALRASGRRHIAVASVWLSDVTAIMVTDYRGFGTIRCASRRATWAIRNRNADYQPFLRRIIDARAVYGLIIAMRPDLGDQGDASAGTDHRLVSPGESQEIA